MSKADTNASTSVSSNGNNLSPWQAMLSRADIKGVQAQPGFNGSAFMDELNDLSRRHTLRHGFQNAPATSKHRRTANAVVKALKRAAKLLGDALAEKNSPVPQALLLGLGRAPAGSLDGVARLRAFQKTAETLGNATELIEERLGSLDQRVKGDQPIWPAEDGLTSHVQLLARDLPELYEQVFGRVYRPNIRIAKHGPPRPSPGLRFVVEAAAEIGVRVTHEAARAAWTQDKPFREQTEN